MTKPKKILLTGGTGFIGRALVDKLLKDNHKLTLWVRDREAAKNYYRKSYSPDLANQIEYYTDLQLVDPSVKFDAMINLAGEPIIDNRWTQARKKQLTDSRVKTTQSLIELIKRLQQKPEALISGSAIGYYGSQPGDNGLDENAKPVDGFTHQLCQQWENIAKQAENNSVRVCLIRTGVVLGDGGALEKMLLPFKLGLGGPVASGKQWMSWIHMDDQIRAIEFLLNNQRLSGVYNLTSPQAVDNQAFSQSLAKQLKRPAFFRVPEFVMKLMLGEAAELLLEGQRVLPANLLQAGFEFKYPDLKLALESILNKKN